MEQQSWAGQIEQPAAVAVRWVLCGGVGLAISGLGMR